MKDTVLPTTIVNHILRHSNFRTIEDRRFIHVVPNKKRFGGALVVVKFELISPPLARIGIGIINPRRLSRPAPAFIIGTGWLLDEQTLVLGFLADIVVVVPLDVGIDDGNKLEQTLVTSEKDRK